LYQVPANGLRYHPRSVAEWDIVPEGVRLPIHGVPCGIPAAGERKARERTAAKRSAVRGRLCWAAPGFRLYGMLGSNI